eukprot:805123-Amphidinium_carterae.1
MVACHFGVRRTLDGGSTEPSYLRKGLNIPTACKKPRGRFLQVASRRSSYGVMENTPYVLALKTRVGEELRRE